ncbi:MAG: cyclase family protein [Candidatus Bathyarchaeia archaeon]
MEKITNLEGVKKLALKVRNWGRWGADDQVGTVNFVTPEKIVKATHLVKKGKVFSLALPFDRFGPQKPIPGQKRFNPIHLMFRSGVDALVPLPPERARAFPYIRSADDMVILTTHGGTHWDALAHIFFEGKMWNGYDCTLVTSEGAQKNGIENYRNKIVGRGVLLDIARYKKVKWLEPGYGITPEDLDGCAKWEKVTIEQGDFLLVRTGQLRQVRERGDWGDYAGGNAPGLTIETAEWLYEKEVAGVASDTWGVEVRPNATPDCAQPWHIIVIPSMGLLMGEMFDFEELAEDCDKDKVYEFLFVAPPLPITGAVGSPINPYAIK